ncbi:MULTISPECIES: DUF2232 domain-containing protein [unclassified Gemella]|uniref:DUF2232 domain-containing protein n=1 Tax=unclassified Gemella TaxID=2624949 RepID=UPI001C05E207|nr:MULTISPECIES: DUF2232 domain-containing protein [unclassified Gemella]MBU0278595.1 YybS family protein [Gemella sp. zg-1178]QWQ38280.1 YybS family protein [Gemella sp. zg-570]
MTNEVAKFEKKLQLIFSKQFFFREPERKKIWLHSISYLLINSLGIVLNIWLITGIASVSLAIYTLGAKGYKIFTPLASLSILIALLFGSYYALIWTIIHTIIVLIIYFSIINRFSKILILVYTAVFLFFSISLSFSILIKLGYINFNPQAIQNYIDEYIRSVVSLQTNIDVDLLRLSFEDIKRHFPSLVFSTIFLYSLILLNYSLIFLSKEKVITPVFPRFSYVLVRSRYTIYYVILSFIVYFAQLLISNKYDMSLLILENSLYIFRWIFVLNGLFTCFYFVEIKNKNNMFVKTLLAVSAYLFNSIFEIIGIVDSVFQIREMYSRHKGGK